ncbi:MAG: hypothetical protein IIX98_05555 [Clostridia bacterium]|nr:hypothetical protein [Clostridia bacterium]MBQ5905019.1 hypothetical protein [Clostridia bacterium]
MSGLDKITNLISEEANAECQKILKAASDEIKNLIAESRKEANKLSREIVDKAKKDAELITVTAKGKAEAITRNRYLEIRNAILNDVISAAYLEIEKLSDEEYFDLVKKLLVKYIQPGECTMFMNGYDLGRLPENFELDINSEVFEKSAVYVSKQAVDIENGFILSYGQIEINCTFKAVFDENMDNLKDMLSPFMFN